MEPTSALKINLPSNWETENFLPSLRAVFFGLLLTAAARLVFRAYLCSLCDSLWCCCVLTSKHLQYRKHIVTFGPFHHYCTQDSSKCWLILTIFGIMLWSLCRCSFVPTSPCHNLNSATRRIFFCGVALRCIQNLLANIIIYTGGGFSRKHPTSCSCFGITFWLHCLQLTSNTENMRRSHFFVNFF